jgi:hypothetical protein
MKATCFSETSVDFQRILRRYISEDRSLTVSLKFYLLYPRRKNTVPIWYGVAGSQRRSQRRGGEEKNSCPDHQHVACHFTDLPSK